MERIVNKQKMSVVYSTSSGKLVNINTHSHLNALSYVITDALLCKCAIHLIFFMKN